MTEPTCLTQWLGARYMYMCVYMFLHSEQSAVNVNVNMCVHVPARAPVGCGNHTHTCTIRTDVCGFQLGHDTSWLCCPKNENNTPRNLDFDVICSILIAEPQCARL